MTIITISPISPNGLISNAFAQESGDDDSGDAGGGISDDSGDDDSGDSDSGSGDGGTSGSDDGGDGDKLGSNSAFNSDGNEESENEDDAESGSDPSTADGTNTPGTEPPTKRLVPGITENKGDCNTSSPNCVHNPARVQTNSVPHVTITDPNDGSTIPYTDITINGTAFDKDNDIEKVEVLVDTYPLDDMGGQTLTAIPSVQKNLANPQDIHHNGAPIEVDWSKWSVPVHFDKQGVYGIRASVTDKMGNMNGSITNINIPFLPSQNENVKVGLHNQTRIALVHHLFTQTAYRDNAFYTFYALNHEKKTGEKVVTNLSMLTARIPPPNTIDPSMPYNIENNLKGFYQIDPYTLQIATLYHHIKNHTLPNAQLTILKDQDVHNGYIFGDKDRKEINAFDVLILFHEEYATKEMYYNYKKFVENGGSILFIDPNVFYAEVSFNKSKNTITLVKGHDWIFDGKSAQKDVSERWFDETNKWVGSSYLISEIKDNITFSNNPFNYSHFEENFVNNPNAKIIIDYKVNLPKTNPYLGSTIATYSLDYGKGKVIMIGLYGEKLISNQKFLDFLDSLLLSFNNVKR